MDEFSLQPGALAVSDSGGYAQLSDEELVRQAQGGDDGAVEFLLRKYQRLVRTWTRPYFLQGAEADDLIQEGMIGLYKAIRDYNFRGSSFWAFARLCITRHVISAIKGTSRQKHLPLNSYLSLHRPLAEGEGDRTLLEVLVSSESQNPESVVLGRERLESAQRYLQRLLSGFEYRVFQLYASGLSYKEMAERLKTRPKSIDNALCRIKQKVGREILSP